VGGCEQKNGKEAKFDELISDYELFDDMQAIFKL
jgi:hypothetical protein